MLNSHDFNFSTSVLSFEEWHWSKLAMELQDDSSKTLPRSISFPKIGIKYQVLSNNFVNDINYLLEMFSVVSWMLWGLDGYEYFYFPHLIQKHWDACSLKSPIVFLIHRSELITQANQSPFHEISDLNDSSSHLRIRTEFDFSLEVVNINCCLKI